ncbi:MAG: 30S ribosomal protein S13 [Methanomicrobiales archaeon]|nr:30S ribosomal protein S13 [Methanomicrobiales archaeon]
MAKETKEAKAGKETKAEREEEIKYFVRVNNVDLDGTKSVQIALTALDGVGRTTARIISRLSQVDPHARIGSLPDPEIDRIRKTVENYSSLVPGWIKNRPYDVYTGEARHLFGTDVLTAKEDDINRMRKIRCYRGIRHETGQKVRGQRTKSTGRTGATVGVTRKKE